MNNIKSFHISMNQGEFKKLQAPARTSVFVRCLSGLIWVTRKGDPTDYIIKAGNEVEFSQQSGELLIQSFATGNEIDVKLCA